MGREHNQRIRAAARPLCRWDEGDHYELFAVNNAVVEQSSRPRSEAERIAHLLVLEHDVGADGGIALREEYLLLPWSLTAPSTGPLLVEVMQEALASARACGQAEAESVLSGYLKRWGTAAP